MDKETLTPLEQEALEKASFTLVGGDVDKYLGTVIGFKEFLLKNGRDVLTQAQLKDLGDVWAAFDRTYQGDKIKQQNNMAETPSLRSVFEKSAQYIGVTQLQRPVFVEGSIAEIDEKLAETHLGSALIKDKIDLSFFSITGANYCCAYQNQKTYKSSFGFCKYRIENKEAKTQRLQQVVLPVISLEPGVINGVDLALLDKVLDPLKELIAVSNHDYYHQVTGALVNPYFSKGGDCNLTDFDRFSSISRHSFKVENFIYDDDYPYLEPAIRGERYEYFAAFMHSQLYNQQMHHEPSVSCKMNGYVKNFFLAVEDVMKSFQQQGDQERADLFGVYFSTLLLHHVTCLVDVNHNLSRFVQARIDKLPVSQQYIDVSLEQINSKVDKIFNLGQKSGLSKFVKKRVKKTYKNSLNYLFAKKIGSMRARSVILSRSYGLFSLLDQDLSDVSRAEAHSAKIQKYNP